MANSVYFYKVRKTSTGNISVITSDKPLTAIKTNDTLGFEVGSRGSSATFGVMFTAGMRSSWDTQEGIRQTGTLHAQGDGTADVIVSNDKTFTSTSRNRK